MVNTCVVSGCRLESYPGCAITYHRIPADKNRRELWITALNLKNNVSKYACVCSLHFKDDDYISMLQKKLTPQAVPTIQYCSAILPETVPESENIAVVESSVNSSSSSPSPSSPSPSSPSPSSPSPSSPSPSSNCEDLGISCEPPKKKIKQEEKSTQTQQTIVSPSKEKLQRDVKILKQKLKRRENRIESLKSIIDVLKKNCD